MKAKSIAPWESVYRRLMQYHEAGMDLDEKTPEIAALKQELSRMMIGTHPEFSRLVDTYMTLDDLFAIRDRLIGSGRIGGKAAGMLLARRILVAEPGETDFAEVLEAHDSFYIGSDVFFTFLVNNDLFRLRLQLSRATNISHEEFAEVEKRFLAGWFSPEIMEQFRDMLAYFGQAPIIARSSSLLEDSFGNAFAGKYHSEYCANQGTPEERLEAFLRAVKLVYASALNPDALTYRRARGLGESDEQMAILVQRVSGMPYKHYFFPSLAGVAFSRNLYAWTDRIDPTRGMIRLVFGLGTRAVNRVGNDYPRMIAVSHPQLRPESGARIAKYSQTGGGPDRSRSETNSRPVPLDGAPRGPRLPEPAPPGLADEGRLPGGPLDEPPRDDDGGAGPDLQQPHQPDRLRPDHRRDAGAPGEGLRPAARHGVHRRGGRGGPGPDQSPPVPADAASRGDGTGPASRRISRRSGSSSGRAGRSAAA